ncbi:MAG: hypothetical protein IPL49_15525 [Saprospirales bacterium]|nr:hypothetical protein [Saprospirales bacterium]
MKTHNKLFLILSGIVFLAATVGCQQPKGLPDSNHPAGETPPVPEKATLELQMPPSPPAEKIQAMNRQDSTRFLYQLVSGENQLFGPFEGRGKVTRLDAGQVMVELEGGQQIQLNYQLPVKEARLRLDSGQDISLLQEESYEGAAQNRLFTLRAGKYVPVSSVRRSAPAPIELSLSDNLQIRQAKYLPKQVVIDSERDTHYAVPLYVIYSGKREQVFPEKGTFTFRDGDFTYELHVLANGYALPKEKNGGAFETEGGYYLDFWLRRI